MFTYEEISRMKSIIGPASILLTCIVLVAQTLDFHGFAPSQPYCLGATPMMAASAAQTVVTDSILENAHYNIVQPAPIAKAKVLFFWLS
jgi:hypothetical protein